jgi:hypothetical protein
MMNILCMRALTLIAPAAAWLPVSMPLRVHGPSPVEVAAMHAAFDPSLGSLRAGRTDAPALFATSERTELAFSQHHSPSLAALRAGFEPTDNEWKWLAIGAGVVLLIFLL